MIRPAQASDWPRIREICCETGHAGAPIDRARWNFFGELWVGPYQKLLSDWSFVATDQTDSAERILGYLTGCPDSAELDFKKALLFTPSLLVRVILGQYPRNSDTRRFIRRSLRLELGPEARFSLRTHRILRREYPAHLHINLDQSVRGGGIGRKLEEAFFEKLKARAVPGVHVFCGAGPVPFYEKTGFSILEQVAFSPSVTVFVMTRKI